MKQVLSRWPLLALLALAVLVVLGRSASADSWPPPAADAEDTSAALEVLEDNGGEIEGLLATPGCADLNGDGVVTLADLLIQLTYFGLTVPPAPPQADLNGDTFVSIADIVIMIKHYNTATTCQTTPIGPGGTPKPTPTPADPPDPALEMSLNVTSPGASCNDPEKPSKCTVPPSSEFTLAVDVNNAPSKGYIGFQTQIVYGSLKYKPTGDGGASEVTWPGGVAPYGFLEVRLGSVTGQEGIVHHLAAASTMPPFTGSAHEDDIVEITLNCPAEGSFEIVLPVLATANPAATHLVKDAMVNVIPAVVGQRNVDVDGDTTPELVDVAATLQVNCADWSVGGVAEPMDVGAAPLDAGGSSGESAGFVWAITASAAAAAAGLFGAMWYVRRRLTR